MMRRDRQASAGPERWPPSGIGWPLAVLTLILAGLALLPGPVLFVAALSGITGLGIELAILRRGEAVRRHPGGATRSRCPRIPTTSGVGRQGEAAWPASTQAILASAT